MDFEIKDGCLNKYTGNGGVVDIPKGTEVIGEMAFFKSAAEVINIPKGVKRINASAFSACTKLKTVNISETVEVIGDNVFYGDIYLTQINVSEKNRFFKSVSGVLYDKGMKTLIVCPKKAEGVFTVPDGIEEIKELSFDSCGQITEIKLPESVTKIGGRAFWGCTKLSRINLDGRIKKLSNSIFYNCPAIKEFTVPDGIEEICGRVFGYCFYLKKAVIPKTVKKIGENCFRDCFRIEEIVLEEGLESIGECAFFDCYKLKTITIPKSVRHLGRDLLGYCRSLKSVEILSENLDDESFEAIASLEDSVEISIYSAPSEEMWNKFDEKTQSAFINNALKNIKSLNYHVKSKYSEYIKKNLSTFLPEICRKASVEAAEFLADEGIINSDTRDLILESMEENPACKAYVVDFLGRNSGNLNDLFETEINDIFSL